MSNTATLLGPRKVITGDRNGALASLDLNVEGSTDEATLQYRHQGLEKLKIYHDDTEGSSGVLKVGTSTRDDITIDHNSGAVTFGTGSLSTITILLANQANQDFADDAAAAAGGIPLNGIYHNSGALRVRIA